MRQDLSKILTSIYHWISIEASNVVSNTRHSYSGPWRQAEARSAPIAVPFSPQSEKVHMRCNRHAKFGNTVSMFGGRSCSHNYVNNRLLLAHVWHCGTAPPINLTPTRGSIFRK